MGISAMRMSPSILPILAFATVAALSLRAADEVQITYAAPKIGDKTLHTLHNEMAVKLQITGGEHSFSKEYDLRENTKMAVTVLDAGKVAATKASVQYLKDDHSGSGPGGVEKSSLPIEGHTYIVANTRTGMEVYDPANKSYAQPDEAELVLGDFQELGRMPRLSKLFAGETFKSGEKITVPDAVAKDLFSDAGTLKNLSITLREVRQIDGQDAAVFDVEAAFERRDGYLAYTAPLKGEIVVGVQTAWPLRIAVTGELKVAGTKPAEGLLPEKKAVGTGTLKYEFTQEFSPAAKK